MRGTFAPNGNVSVALWPTAAAPEHSRQRSKMANILTADLPSDDEQDDDFDPAQDNGASDTEKKRSTASRKRRRFGAQQPADEIEGEGAEEVSH